jgi:leader peptidase (prepilin peptidase)/N-methyltransferase
LVRWVGAIFAGLFGVAFGSFLNVVLARFPEDESIIAPRSHCRHCDHVLAWWENLPVLSWILLRGRCRKCRAWIGVRYPLVEIAMGILWTACWLSFEPSQWTATHPLIFVTPIWLDLAFIIKCGVLCWLLVLLALLDAEFFWLPDWFTLPGIGLGFLTWVLEDWLIWGDPAHLWQTIWMRTLAIAAAAGLILFIRLTYWLVRRVEGMGLGDAKLMAMLAAWLDLRGALECFAIAIFAAAAAAIVWLGILAIRRSTHDWGKMPLPLGTFLCAAAITEIFYPHWLTARMHLELLGLGN